MRNLSRVQYRELAEFRQELESFGRCWRRAANHLGLQAKEYDLMLVIRGAGHGTDVDIPEAGRRMLTDGHDIFKFVSRLEKRKLLRRYGHRGTRRVLLRITPAGEAVLRKLVRRTLDDLQIQGPSLAKAVARIAGKRQFPQSTAFATRTSQRNGLAQSTTYE